MGERPSESQRENRWEGFKSTLDSNQGIEQTKQQWNQSSTANFQARGKEERIRRERPPKSQLQRDKRFFTTTIHRQLGDNSFDQKTNSNQQGNIYASQGEENNKTQSSNPTHRSPQRRSHSDKSNIWSQAEAKQLTTQENKETRTQNYTLPIGGQGRWSCRGRARPRVTAPDTDTAPTTGRGGGSIPVDETQQEQRVGKL